MSKPFLHHPSTPEELRELVRNLDVDLRTIDISKVSDLSRLFVTDYDETTSCFVAADRYDFTGVATWDVSHVTNMEAMFAGCRYFDEDLRNWDVRQVTNMRSMFEGCTFLDQPFAWNTESLVDASRMFKDCYALESSITLNMMRAKSYKDMFLGAQHLRARPELINFSARKYHATFPHEHVNSPASSIYFLKQIRATSASAQATADKSSLYRPHSVQEARLLLSDPHIQPRNLDLSKMSVLRGLCATESSSFALREPQQLDKLYPQRNVHLPLLTTLDLDSKNLDELDCRGATDLSYFFAGQQTLNSPLNLKLPAQLDSLAYMFTGCSRFNQPLNFLNQVKKLRLAQGLLENCASFNQRISLRQDKLISTHRLLANCLSFNRKVEVTSQHLTDVSEMFVNCREFNHQFQFASSQLTDAHSLLKGCRKFNQPVKLDAEQLRNADQMFAGCTAFDQVINFKSEALQSCQGMLRGCSSFNSPVQLNLTQATHLQEMFADCSSLRLPVAITERELTLLPKRINLVSSQLKQCKLLKMFANCEQLEEFTLHAQIRGSLTNAQQMFAGCTQLNLSRSTLNALLPEPATASTAASSLSEAEQHHLATGYQGIFSGCTKLLCTLIPQDTPVVELKTLFAGTAALDIPSAQSLIKELLWNSQLQKYQPRTVQQLRLLLSDSTIICQQLQCSDLISLQGAWEVSGTHAYTAEAEYNEFLPRIGNHYDNGTSLLLSKEQWNGFTAIFDDLHGKPRFPSGITNLDYCLAGQEHFDQPLENWDFSRVESMQAILQDCRSFNQRLPQFRFSKVRNTAQMLHNCTSFNQPVELILNEVEDCTAMFAHCTQFNQPLSLHLPHARTLTSMFEGCLSFNQLVYLVAPQAQSLHRCFAECRAFNQPIAFTKAQVEDLSEMFQGCTHLNQSFTLSLPQARNLKGLFQDCCALNSQLEIYAPCAEDFSQMMAGTTAFKASLRLIYNKAHKPKTKKFWKGNQALQWYKRVKFKIPFILGFSQAST